MLMTSYLAEGDAVYTSNPNWMSEIDDLEPKTLVQSQEQGR